MKLAEKRVIREPRYLPQTATTKATTKEIRESKLGYRQGGQGKAIRHFSSKKTGMESQ